MLKNFTTELDTKGVTSVPKYFKFERYNNFTLTTGTPITLKIAGAYTTVSIRHHNHGTIKRTAKDTYVVDHGNLVPYRDRHGAKGYVNHNTGEIAPKHKIKHKSSTKNQVNYKNEIKRDSKIRDLIHANFNGGYNEIMLSITYGKEYDTKNIRVDAHSLIRKIKRNLKLKTKELVYISVYEPQASGNLHCHLMIKFLNKTKTDMTAIRAYLKQAWKKGYSQVKTISRPDYLAKNYFAISKKDSSKNKRLSKMPSGSRTFDHSQNCEKPLKVDTEYNYEVKKFIGIKLFSRAYRATVTANGYIYSFNCYTGYYYNKNRNENIKRATAMEQIMVGNYDDKLIRNYKKKTNRINRSIEKLEHNQEFEKQSYRIGNNSKKV